MPAGWTVDVESSCEKGLRASKLSVARTQNSSPGRDPICYSTSVTSSMIPATAGWVNVPEEK